MTVDVREAGEGKLEISIKNPSGQMIGNKVSSVTRTPGLYQVTCVPLVSGAHNVNVMFNGEHADGEKFNKSNNHVIVLLIIIRSSLAHTWGAERDF